MPVTVGVNNMSVVHAGTNGVTTTAPLWLAILHVTG